VGNRSGIISLAKIRYQETSSDETTEELQIVERTTVCVRVNCNVCKSAIALYGLYLSVIKRERECV
jgi:hypothetical protein